MKNKKNPATFACEKLQAGVTLYKLMSSIISGCHRSNLSWYRIVFIKNAKLVQNLEVDYMAALAIDKVGPRPYHFRTGPTSGPTIRP